MWTVRILSGPQRGQTFQLKEGRNLLGRRSSCYIQIQSHGVSKEHCEILVSTQSLNISDLNSSNGTFVNGVRIQKSKLRVGDKISLNEVMLDIQTLSPQIRSSQGLSVVGAQAYYPPPPLAESSQLHPEDQPAASFVVHHHGGLFERLWM